MRRPDLPGAERRGVAVALVGLDRFLLIDLPRVLPRLYMSARSLEEREVSDGRAGEVGGDTAKGDPGGGGGWAGEVSSAPAVEVAAEAVPVSCSLSSSSAASL